MQLAKVVMVTSALILLSTVSPTSGWAADSSDKSTVAAARDLPDGTEVTVTGTVDDFQSRHPFTLRDASGTIKVDLSSAKPIVLRNGERVTITGAIDKSLLETDIAATDVTINNEAGAAQKVSIKTLPEVGLVKIDGVVDSIDSGQKFTLKDSTGRVDVIVPSDALASLKQGAPVTVLGNVNQGALEKSIDATQVDVRSDSSPAATP